MSLKKDYLGITKLDEGYGGWGCPCCNPFSMSPRKMKTRARRMMRHIQKQKWKKEVDQDT